MKRKVKSKVFKELQIGYQLPVSFQRENQLKTFLNKIICGDSLELLKELPDNFIHLIITSPPYFGCRVYGNETLGREEPL